MSDYTQEVFFGPKDNLNPGDTNKIIRGSEFDAEFGRIATAVNSKANIASPTFTGTLTVENLIASGTVTASEIDGGTY